MEVEKSSFYDSMSCFINSGYLLFEDVNNVTKCCHKCIANVPKYVISIISSSLSSTISSSLLSYDNMKELVVYETSNCDEKLIDLILNINSIRMLSLQRLYLENFTIVNDNCSVTKSSIFSLDLSQNLLNGSVLVDFLYHYSSIKFYDLKTLVLDDSLQLHDESTVQQIIDIINSLNKLMLRRTPLKSIENLKVYKLQEISFENCFKLNRLTFEKNSSLSKLDISWTSISEANLKDILSTCLNLKVLSLNYCLKLINIEIFSNVIEELYAIGCSNTKRLKLHCNRMKILNVQLCTRIEEIDLENQIVKLDLSMLQNLSVLKLKCPYLKYIQLAGCKTFSVGKRELSLLIKDCHLLNVNDLIENCIEGSGISFDGELKSLQQNKKWLDKTSNNNYNSYNRPFNHRRSASV